MRISKQTVGLELPLALKSKIPMSDEFANFQSENRSNPKLFIKYIFIASKRGFCAAVNNSWKQSLKRDPLVILKEPSPSIKPASQYPVIFI